MRRELQLPIYSLRQVESDRLSANTKNGLFSLIARITSRIRELNSLDVSEHSPHVSGSAYAGFVSRQRVGRAR